MKRIIPDPRMVCDLPEVVALGAFVLELNGRYPHLRRATDALERITPAERERLLALETAADTASRTAFAEHHQRRVDLARGQ